MNPPNREQQEVQGGQAFDALMSVVFAVAASAFVFRAVQLIEQHAPEAGVAAAGLGVVAVALTGVSIYEYHRFTKPRQDS